jgi:uncharacterized protein (TIGR02266 family)
MNGIGFPNVERGTPAEEDGAGMSFLEKRRHPRHPFIAEIRFSSDSPPITARIADLSEGGVFVDTVTPLEEGATVSVSFYLPGDSPESPVTGTGRVAWSQATVGMGIEFDVLDEGGRRRIKTFLAGV